ncbi:DUF2975 domain-containing protein [Clostridium manihotivorum]|uniref:DUF2975 domain-containing protein n=1 Tax=Clostridium manihotivorum TaxID=2320868 RepID=A0A410DMD5_9CLOT|nr:DUF2975 domain-containing protein [Clostridium manihotivorum]QAA30240.1 DUF2975 domain-containing protein [Clostridium manihotivorum]
MKYYGQKSMASVLKRILDFILILGIIATLFIFKDTFINNDIKLDCFKKVVIFVLLAVGISCVFLIVVNLRKILLSLVKANPFINENVRALKMVSRECFIIAGCYIFNMFINSNLKDFNFIYVDGKGIHTDMEFIIFLFAGCFILILAKVFQQAVDYKEENDSTI